MQVTSSVGIGGFVLAALAFLGSAGTLSGGGSRF